MVKIYTEILFLLIISATSLLATNTERVKILDKRGAKKLLKLSCVNNDMDIVKELIKKYGEHYTPELYSKVLLGIIRENKNINIDLVKLLINNNADVNCESDRDDEWGSCLHMACNCDEINLELVKLLIDNNADVNHQADEEHDTCLHIACNKINLELVKLLINKNAYVNTEVLELYGMEEDSEYSYSSPLERLPDIDSLPTDKKEYVLEITRLVLHGTRSNS